VWCLAAQPGSGGVCSAAQPRDRGRARSGETFVVESAAHREVVEELTEGPDTTSGVALGSDEPVIWPPSTAPFVWQVRFGPCR